jgi:long-chain acyl-CoA synthetase
VQLWREQQEQWSYADLAWRSRALAAGLSVAGLAAGQRVLLYAPNSPNWILACLALLELGAIPVPVDSQLGGEELDHILDSSAAQWAFTSERLAPGLQRRDHPLRLLLLDGDVAVETHIERLITKPGRAPYRVTAEREAVLFYTSGTSGPPKGVPLSHENLLGNLQAILAENIVTSQDRLLLPLPLHHVYPFALGLLAPLSLGMSLLLPYSLTGPQLLRALNQGGPSAILGIPRLYGALFSAIEQRLAGAGPLRLVFHALLRCCVFMGRHTPLRPGRRLFTPLRRRLGPHLRLLISGGVALDQGLAWRLDGLGWELASGYGLTETSPILCVTPPGARRYASAGRVLRGVELRTAEPAPGEPDGEVQARGCNVFSGYLDLPDKTDAAFTKDGWFRSGDLGHLDERGWLYLSGRTTSRIVLAGGENIDPTRLEQRLENCPSVREAGVLEWSGRLAALVVPTPQAARHETDDGLLAQLREEITDILQDAPSYARLDRLRLDRSALPRTRLGKLRRHRLSARFQVLEQGQGTNPQAGPTRFDELAPEDRQLLEDATAARVWDWLGGRFEGRSIDPDSDLRLDLGVDSLAWLSLTMDLQNQAGVALEEEAVFRIENIRDLLRESAAATQAGHTIADLRQRLTDPEALLEPRQQRWLEPPRGFTRLFGELLHLLVRWGMHGLYHLRVSGIEHLPREGPSLLTPNHLSLLDPLVILAVLDRRQRQRICWGGWTGLLFHRPWTRLVSRALRVLPVEPRTGPLSSLALGAAALQRGCTLIWFPEGMRSPDGKLQTFRPGVGNLAENPSVALIPVRIDGTREALPPGSLRVRWRRSIHIYIGSPLAPRELERQGMGETPAERIADALQQRVGRLGA